MSKDDRRYDIIWGPDGPPYIDYHFCRDWGPALYSGGEYDDEGGCYGYNLLHGMTREEVKRAIIEDKRAWQDVQKK